MKDIVAVVKIMFRFSIAQATSRPKRNPPTADEKYEQKNAQLLK
jgi:hypothetical protein